MKKQIIIIVTLLFATISNVSAIEKYITDDARVYLRRGPSTQYAFSGSINAGEKVTIIETSGDGKYTRIKDSNGRIAWIDTSDLSDQPSAKDRIPALEAQLADYKNRVDNSDSYQKGIIDDYVQKLKNAEQQISILTDQNSKLQKQVSDQSEKIDSMSLVVDEKQGNFVFRWFIYGGLVAFAGVVLGLILPAMTPSRRKQRWMH